MLRLFNCIWVTLFRYLLVFFLACLLLFWICGGQYIPSLQVGRVRQLWPATAFAVTGEEDRSESLEGRRGEVLGSGLHFGYFPWQYCVRAEPAVRAGEGAPAKVLALGGLLSWPRAGLGCGKHRDGLAAGGAILERDGPSGLGRVILGEGKDAIRTALSRRFGAKAGVLPGAAAPARVRGALRVSSPCGEPPGLLQSNRPGS